MAEELGEALGPATGKQDHGEERKRVGQAGLGAAECPRRQAQAPQLSALPC